MDLNTTLKAIITANATKDLNLTRASDPLNHTRTLSLPTGKAGYQANQSWHDQRTLASAQFEDLNLSLGELTDAFGDPVQFAALKGIYLENLSAGDSLLVGAAAAAPLDSLFGQVTDRLRIAPGGFVLIAAPDAIGYAVTEESADQLRLTHSGDTPEPLVYRIVLIGTTTNE